MLRRASVTGAAERWRVADTSGESGCQTPRTVVVPVADVCVVMFAANPSKSRRAVDVQLIESGPQGNGWHVRYDNDQNTARSATVTALCLKNKLKVSAAGLIHKGQPK
mgnify:CR=1 FL=1